MLSEVEQNYSTIRRRLFNPANAKSDTGISLRRITGVRGPQPMKKDPPIPPSPPPSWLYPLYEQNEQLRSLFLGRDIPPNLPQHPSVRDIQIAVAKFFGVSVNDLICPSRSSKIIPARHVAMALCRHLTKRSLTEIGRAFGGRDHTTIISAVRKISTGINAAMLITRESASASDWVRAVAEAMGMSCIGGNEGVRR